MFDIGFSELMIIGIVALIVIGPERLPRVARTMGHLFGRMQRYVADVKSDISREIELDELRKLQSSMQDAARSFQQTVTQEVSAAESGLQQIARDADLSAGVLPPPESASATPAAAPGEPRASPGPLSAAEAQAQLDLELGMPRPSGDTRA